MDIILFERLATPFPSSFEEKNNLMKCRMKCMLGILFFFFQFNFSFAQPSQIKRTWHWYFGNQTGIDFSSGTAVADTNGALINSEGCASISDTAGNLQFYSDGRTIWNRNHQVMPNGTGIMGGANGSSTQQALIIPKPLSPNIYYLFTTDEAENIGANGMRYTVIDMNLDGGMGDVDVTQKNILLFAPCTEKLAAVNHCNDTSVWVMGHEVNNNHFRAFLVTANGIDTNAVVSPVGFPNMSNSLYGIAGAMKFSPDGKLVCSISDSAFKKVELFEFNAYSGTVFNSFTLPTNNTSLNRALSFSSNSSFLYIGKFGNNQPMLQFDVSIYDSLLISNSQVNVSPIFNRGSVNAQNAPDGKIYFIEGSLIQTDSLIAAIENPNSPGTNCNFNPNVANLATWQLGFGLPNFNESYFRLNTSSICFTEIAEIDHNLFEIYPNPARDWIEVRGSGINEIALFDVLGNLCYKAAGSFISHYLMDISNLSKGVYLLRLSSAKQFISKVFLKH